MSSESGRLLLVDDDRVLLEALAHWLARDGWRVERAESLAAARALAEKGRFDLAIVDFVLPDGDGVELVRDLRARGMECPVLALTGAGSETVYEELVRAGANHALDKAGLTRGALLDAIDLARASPAYPARVLRPSAPAAPDDALEGLAPGRALVIDDVAAMRRLLRAHLESAGWRVDEASDATEGVRMAARHGHDVILLDYLLPDVDGVGAFQELRRQGCEAPVVVLSAHGAEAVATEFAMAGAADFLPKETLTRARLLSAVARARETARAVSAHR